MDEAQILRRIVVDAKVMVGKPIIRGTRLTVAYVLSLLAHGSSHADILAEYSGLRDEDIRACLLFAERSLEDISFMPSVAGAA